MNVEYIVTLVCSSCYSLEMPAATFIYQPHRRRCDWKRNSIDSAGVLLCGATRKVTSTFAEQFVRHATNSVARPSVKMPYCYQMKSSEEQNIQNVLYILTSANVFLAF